MQDLAFGLFDWIDEAPGRTVGEVYEDRLRLLAEADRGGFDVYHLAEHHGAPLWLSPSPAVHVSLVEQCLLRPWPGNVRELLVEIRSAASAVQGEGRRVEARHLAATAGTVFGSAAPEARRGRSG